MGTLDQVSLLISLLISLSTGTLDLVGLLISSNSDSFVDRDFGSGELGDLFELYPVVRVSSTNPLSNSVGV